MDLKFIQSELEKLTAMVASWNNDEAVATIERDIALDKIKNIYNAMRFEAQPIATPIIPAPVTEPEIEPSNNTDEPQEEPEVKDVEVEFIFAEEDIDFAEPIAEEEPESEIPTVEPKAAPIEPIAAESPIVENPAVEQAVTIAKEPEPEPHIEKPAPAEHPAKPAMDSLFGGDEIRRQPRTKHQRMMSIYDDAPSRHEKVVDISKIFDMDIEPEPSTPAPKPISQPEPKRPIRQSVKPEPAATPIPEEKPIVLGESIAANTHTLADTIAAPTPLAEEITNSRIHSLRDAIGLNDKFLMIRDLFDGDGDAYNQAIAELDAFDSFDDCMIYIVENYAWNPESEGAKFMMQILERKLA